MFSKDAVKGIAVAIIFVVLGQVILAWQYYRLEAKRLPKIEQELVLQRADLEKESAKKAVTSFLNAWQQGNVALATKFLTENGVYQEGQGSFSLGDMFSSYKIISIESTGNNDFRVQAETYEQEGLPPVVRIMRSLKILDSYYIDSVVTAG